ncbi:MAG: hypothetical protein HOA17_04025 [Candidatus Melainabacteria bacterium]|jgi:hypothetical protein|nr:hypothetical protein [Candidatus Melainabacteria bacterium]
MVIGSFDAKDRLLKLMGFGHRTVERRLDEAHGIPAPTLIRESRSAEDLMQPDIDANLQQVINFIPIQADLIKSEGDLRLSDPRYLDEAHSLAELRADPVYPVPYQSNWLREKVISDIKDFDSSVLSDALDDLHNDLAVPKRFRNCPYINKQPSLKQHLDGSIDLAWRFMQDAGVKPESRFGEIVAWMIKIHDAGEAFGEFTTDSEARAVPDRHSREDRIALEERISKNLLLFKIDSALRSDSKKYQEFLDNGRKAFGDSNGNDAITNIKKYLDDVSNQPHQIKPRAQVATDRLMVFFEAFEEGKGFAAAFARAVEKLETFAYILDHHIDEQFTAEEITSVIEYPLDPINHMLDLAEGLDNDIVSEIARVVNNYYQSGVRYLLGLIEQKNGASS